MDIKQRLKRRKMGRAISFRGERLKAIREQLGMSQEDIERQIGFGHGMLSRYENGVSDPLHHQIVQIYRVLDISADYLLGLSDNPETIKPALTLTIHEKMLIEDYRAGRLLELAQSLIAQVLVARPKRRKDTSPKKRGSPP